MGALYRSSKKLSKVIVWFVVDALEDACVVSLWDVDAAESSEFRAWDRPLTL